MKWLKKGEFYFPDLDRFPFDLLLVVLAGAAFLRFLVPFAVGLQLSVVPSEQARGGESGSRGHPARTPVP